MLRFFTEHKRTILLALAALVVVAIKTALTIRLDWNIADESFLWYGMQRVSHGDVPLRDYMAYDPARYYWGGLVMALMSSKGIFAMRIGDAIFEAVGLFLALTLLGTSFDKKRWLFGLLATITLSIWMLPRFKVFDHTASIALICALAYLIQSPSLKRYFICGFVIGLAAFVGRNHGVYGLAGMLLAVIYINLRARPVPLGRAFVVWLGGVLLGYSPAILMMLFVPGFTKASMDMIRVIAANGTNLPLPVPWPWRVHETPGLPISIALGNLATGFLFVALLAFGVGSLMYIFYKRWKGVTVSPALAACAVLCLPYAHYAFSRAESNHLSFGGFPLFIGLLLISRRLGVVLQTLFAAGFLAATYAIFCYQLPGATSSEWVNVDGAQLKVNRTTAQDVAILTRVEHKYASAGESYMVVPVWPGAYPLFERKSPIWDLYSLFPRDLDYQNKEIADMKRANLAFILIVDKPPDGDGQLLFKNTNPHVMAYIRANYVESAEIPEDPTVHLYLPKRQP